MATDLQLIKDMLERRGYTNHLGSITNSEYLGHKEYLLGLVSGGKHILQLGPGRSGEENCNCTLYFTEHGDFYEHSSDVAENEASDFDTEINGQPRP
jgi:hypothetical protein